MRQSDEGQVADACVPTEHPCSRREGRGATPSNSPRRSLLEATGERLDLGGVPWRRLDCESVEPTAGGLLTAMGVAFGTPMASVDAAAAALAAMGPRVVVALDQYERLRLLDAWTAAPGWSGLVQTLRLGPLGGDEARAWLAQRPLSAPVRDRVLKLCAGHPLALQLAVRSATERARGTAAGDALSPAVERRPLIEVLAPLFLDDVQDPLDRRLLEAACLVRRATRSTLAVMVGEGTSPEAFGDSSSAAATSSTRSSGRCGGSSAPTAPRSRRHRPWIPVRRTGAPNLIATGPSVNDHARCLDPSWEMAYRGIMIPAQAIPRATSHADGPCVADDIHGC